MKVIKLIAGFFLHPLFLLLLVAVLISASVYSYLQYQQSQQDLKKFQVELEELRKFRQDPQSAAGVEVRAIVNQVGELINLPEEEFPTVATITDVEKLREQPFFAKAENGDKVLIYVDSRKAILYRPSTNKIVEVAPVNVSQKDQEQLDSENQNGETDTLDGETTVTPTVGPEPTQASDQEATGSGAGL